MSTVPRLDLEKGEYVDIPTVRDTVSAMNELLDDLGGIMSHRNFGIASSAYQEPVLWTITLTGTQQLNPSPQKLPFYVQYYAFTIRVWQSERTKTFQSPQASHQDLVTRQSIRATYLTFSKGAIVIVSHQDSHCWRLFLQDFVNITTFVVRLLSLTDYEYGVALCEAVLSAISR